MITAKDLPKACFLCGRNGAGDPLDAHHIFGGANRKLSERYALVIPLCHDRCHENGKDAVHRNGAVAQAVHEFGQRLAMERMGWSIEEFREVFGRNYLPEPSGSEDLCEDPSGGPVSFQTGPLANGEPSGGPVSFQQGKKSGKESCQRAPSSSQISRAAHPRKDRECLRAFDCSSSSPQSQGLRGDHGRDRRAPLETLPDGQGRNLRVSPIGSSFRGTGDEGREAVGSSFLEAGDGGSAPIGSPCVGRETGDVTSVKDRGEAAASTRRGGATECQRASAETQSADAKPMRYATTRDGGFRITEEEDLPEWLMI